MEMIVYSGITSGSDLYHAVTTRVLNDGEESEYRAKYWPKMPGDFVGQDWLVVNTHRRQKFRHVVVVSEDRIDAAMVWATENFGPNAVGNTGTKHPRYWTRGVWTVLMNEDNSGRMMFLESGMATMAKVFWG